MTNMSGTDLHLPEGRRAGQPSVKQVELLSPAGTLKNMRYAFAYGADAVYAGLPRYSLRVRNNDFLKTIWPKA